MTSERDHGLGGFESDDGRPERPETPGGEHFTNGRAPGGEPNRDGGNHRHAPDQRRGPDAKHEPDPKGGTSRDDEHERMADPTLPGPAAPHESGSAPDVFGVSAGTPGLTTEEEVLRRLLHDTVQDVHGSVGALDHLRRAIPARRAHRRQALVGVAASLLLAVTAVPALIHTANTASDSASRPGSNPGHHAEQGGKGESELGPTRGPGSGPTVGGHSEGGGDKDEDSESEEQPSDRSPGKGGGAADPSNTATEALAECVPAQLSQSPAAIDPADADGRVYGVFRVVNASQEGCTLSAQGQVSAVAQGSADPAKVTTVAHTPGDPATELPDATAQVLVLGPGDAFVVRFGWVPESGTNGCSSTTDPTAGGGDSGTSEDVDGETGDGGSDDPSTAPPGSVSVTYTPPGGAGSASGQIDNVCAGTVYHTPPIAAV